MNLLIRNVLIFAALFFLVERFCRLQTDGFSIAKIVPHSPLQQDTTSPNPEVLKALSQPYYFLGSGVQCYAFLSEDKKTVLKFFKHYHLFPSNNVLKNIPFPYKQKLTQMREERLHKIFKSCQIAFDNLQEETGLLFIHFTQVDCPKITIYDKIGSPFQLDLSEMEFVLQKKAECVSSRFKRLFLANDNNGIEEALEKLKNLHLLCVQKGFKTKDSKIRNYAFIGEDPVIIDIGSFKRLKTNYSWDIERGQEKFARKLNLWRDEFEKNS